MVSFVDEATKQRVQAAQMVQLADIGDIYKQANVMLVSSILSENDWDNLFPERHEKYGYWAFLKSVAMYPAFCNEFKPARDNLQSQELACRRELATLLAHMMYETQEMVDGELVSLKW